MSGWDDTVVLITGVGHGIGLALAERLGRILSGKSLLIITSRSKSHLDQLANSIHSANSSVRVGSATWDLRKPNSREFEKDIQAILQTTGTTATSFKRAVICHNAARLGSMALKVSQFDDVSELQEQLNVNVVSTIALNSVFLRLFHSVPSRTVVNFTAPSATTPRPSFGLTSMCKAARQLTFSILAAEDKDVKVLHYDPGAVDTESLRAIRDESHDKEIRKWCEGFYQRGEVLAVDVVVSALVKTLAENQFQSGSVISAYNVTL